MSRDCDKLYSVGKFCTSLSRDSTRQQIARTTQHAVYCKFVDIIVGNVSKNLKEQSINFLR